MKITKLATCLVLAGCALMDVRPVSQTDRSITLCVPTPANQNPDEMARAYCADKGMKFKASPVEAQNCHAGAVLGQTRAYECVN